MRNRQSPQKTRAAIFSQQVWASAERLNWTMKNFWIFLKLQNITIKHVARITSGWNWRHSLHKTPEFIGHVTGSALWLCRLHVSLHFLVVKKPGRDSTSQGLLLCLFKKHPKLSR